MIDEDRRRNRGVEDLPPDLRQHVSAVLSERASMIAADAAPLFTHTVPAALDDDYCGRLAGVLVDALSAAVQSRVGTLRGIANVNLRTIAFERSLDIHQLFALASVAERCALDELALDESFGATSEDWPAVAQMVRGASFECLASFVERTDANSAGATITDPLTTLHTRAVFDAVLGKEAERAGRFGRGLALILFDVDRLGEINERYGYGVGNRILERVGVLLRTFFRQHDWVARYGDDAVAVLLMESDASHAGELADRARTTVAERLAFADHRTGTTVAVTMSAAVVNIPGAANAAIDPVRLLLDAESALARAKQGGRNRVEVASGTSASRAPLRSSPST